MIKLIPSPTFEATVLLTVAGESEPLKLAMVFNHKTADEAGQWFAANHERSAADALDELIVSWSGVMGDDGKLVEYSKAALETLLQNYRPAANEIVRAWQKELTESRVKN